MARGDLNVYIILHGRVGNSPVVVYFSLPYWLVLLPLLECGVPTAVPTVVSRYCDYMQRLPGSCTLVPPP